LFGTTSDPSPSFLIFRWQIPQQAYNKQHHFRRFVSPSIIFAGRRSCDKICMMMTRLACNRAIESSYWRMDNDSDVGLLMGYVLYRLPVELEFMDLDTFPHWFGLHPSLHTSW
jgi:hypothetical protein